VKRFSFRLERVLELRRYDETLAEARLGEKSAVCSRLGLSLEANARATLEAARERFRPGGNAADHRAGELYSVRLSQERERLMKALAAAEAERETARAAYVEASKAKEIVAKLREREEGAYYKTVSREETKTMDDLAAGAHIRASTGFIHNESQAEGHHGIVR
jgi:flagellar export protein FliJ